MITLQEVLRLHDLSISFFGGSHGIRDNNLLESAIGRISQTFGGEELYPINYHKAAALIESIVKNHPFVDGNKRTGFLAAQIFLKKNKILLTASENEAYDFVIDIASSKIDFDDIVVWLKNNTKQL